MKKLFLCLSALCSIAHISHLSAADPKKASRQLVFAAREGQEERAMQLLQVPGVDIDAVNIYGECVLTLAVRSNSKKIVNQLLDMDADFDDLSEDRATPLIEAASRGRTRMVRQLLNKGADTNIAFMFKNTALEIAARRDHKEIVELLLKAGAKKGDAEQAAQKAGYHKLADFIRDYKYSG